LPDIRTYGGTRLKILAAMDPGAVISSVTGISGSININVCANNQQNLSKIKQLLKNKICMKNKK
jgi:hypothetical protein